MRILHTYCLNYNLGDSALGIGVKSLLRKHMYVDLIAETNLQGREFSEYYITEVVNKRFDLLVIGGGGIIHGSHWPNGWFWLIDQENIRKIEIPFIVYGAGYNYWEEEGGIPDKGKIHLEETIRRATYFSVRNDGSANRVSQQIAMNLPVVPDPGFHVLDEVPLRKPIDGKFVMVQLADDKSDSRFGNRSTREQFLNQLRAVLNLLSNRYQIILAPHVYEDIRLCKEAADGIKNSQIWDFGRFAFDNAKDSLAFYRDAEFVIAMRGHGQIVPIGLSTPVIALCNHPKHSGLMQNLGLADYCVSVGESQLAEKLLEKISIIEQNNDMLQSQLRLINARLNSATNLAFKEIAAQITNFKAQGREL